MLNKLNNTRLSMNRSAILRFYSLSYHCAAEIVCRTKILVRTVIYNMVKIRQQDNMEHRGGNGRPCKIPVNIDLSVSQWIRRNKESTAKNIL